MFENGIKKFIKGQAQITVHFPVDFNDREYVRCTMCPFLSSNERVCQLNKEPVQFPQKYIGYDCPLSFEEEENHE